MPPNTNTSIRQRSLVLPKACGPAERERTRTVDGQIIYHRENNKDPKPPQPNPPHTTHPLNELPQYAIAKYSKSK